MRKNRKIIPIDSDTIEAPDEGYEDAYEKEYNHYYDKVSSKYRTFKIVCVFVLCTFILGSLVLFGELFTYENARYVIRDINQILEEDSSVPAQRITFDSDGEMDYAFYRSNLVVAGNSSVKLIGKSGKVKLVDKTQFISPTIEVSDKYCIVYSLGAYNLSVYNSVARVHDLRFDYPIFDVALSDKGHIAVMTQNREYRCCVYLYDSNFNLLSTYRKTDYPSSVTFSKTSSELCITTFGVSNGDYYTTVDMYGFTDTQPRFSYTCSLSIPYDTFTSSNGNAVVLGEKSIIHLDASGNLINRYNTDGNITDYHFDHDLLVISHTGAQQNVISFDASGKPDITKNLSDITSVFIFDNKVYVQKKDALVDIDDSSDGLYKLNNVPQKVIYEDGYAYLCYNDCIISVEIK